jgi:hypothetical protein
MASGVTFSSKDARSSLVRRGRRAMCSDRMFFSIADKAACVLLFSIMPSATDTIHDFKSIMGA